MPKKVAIVGAGPAGLMAAEVLSKTGTNVHIFEQMPSAARKFLMAGKTGLNISHAEDLNALIERYDAKDWLAPWIKQYNAHWIQEWMQSLGIESYVGTSGRIFPKEMKAAPLLRAWLKRLNDAGVQFHYRHRCTDLTDNRLTYDCQGSINTEEFDAIVLACGAVSWSKLGSDGAWQAWLKAQEVTPFMPSNVGVTYAWSSYMESLFGQPLKRIHAWVKPHTQKIHGDIVLTHYGLESGVIYKLNRCLREQFQHTQQMEIVLDLLPDISVDNLAKKLCPQKKQSTANIWRKAGLDAVKGALIREIVPKDVWSQPQVLAQKIKHLTIPIDGFRPIEEAISCAGGVKQDYLTEDLQLKTQPNVFCCGEMLDWDAPTGGYLLTACFATGRVAGNGVKQYLKL